MLDHEMELEQLKLDKESELSTLLQNQMLEPTETEWRDKYQALLKDTEAEKTELQRKNRLEIEGLRSRFVHCMKIVSNIDIMVHFIVNNCCIDFVLWLRLVCVRDHHQIPVWISLIYDPLHQLVRGIHSETEPYR